jgi:hypothetical protein
MCSRPKIQMPASPAPPPDYADQAVRDVELAERQKTLAATSRRKSFVSGAGGVAGSIVPVAVKKVMGS